MYTLAQLEKQQVGLRIPKYLVDDIEELRATSLMKCIVELKKRSDMEALSYRMQIMYPFVLALDGKYAEAHEMLDTLLLQYPEKKSDLLLRQATLYTEEKRWGEVYETLRKYNMVVGEITLSAVLQNINAIQSRLCRCSARKPTCL